MTIKAAVLDAQNKVINVILLDNLEQEPGAIDGNAANIGDVWDGAEFVGEPVDLSILRVTCASQIDDRVATVIEKWTRFKEGYAKREAAARAYKLAGYTGDATRWITSFASNADKTNQQAADIIIGQADGLNLALEDLEDLRMQKYKILLANEETVIRTEHQRIMSEIDVIVGGLT